jgi:hypothetical protein
VDAMNPRPRVWPSVAELLRQRFPELHENYRKILFDPRTRKMYLEELQGRVHRAADKLGMAKNVSVCC